MGHTPGPWTVDKYGKEGFEVWATGGPTWSFRVAVTGHAYTFDQANAHLIATAPELLEALEEIVAISDRKHDAWDRAKAVIAKAKGM